MHICTAVSSVQGVVAFVSPGEVFVNEITCQHCQRVSLVGG